MRLDGVSLGDLPVGKTTVLGNANCYVPRVMQSERLMVLCLSQDSRTKMSDSTARDWQGKYRSRRRDVLH